MYTWLFLELCTYLAKVDKYVAVFFPETVYDFPNYEDSAPVSETGSKAMKVAGWLQSLSYAKLN